MTKKSEAASKEVAEVDQDRIDRVIWRGIGVKSVRQIAEEAGIKPEEVLRRKGELLDEIDVLSVQEKKQKMLVQLQQIAQKTQSDYEASPWEFKSGLMNSSVSAMKTVLSEMNRLEKADSEKVNTLNLLRKREIVNLYVSVVDGGVRRISEKFGIPESEMFEIFNDLMREEALRLDV